MNSLYDSIKIRDTRSLLAFMKKIQNIIKKLYWLGLIGVIGTVFHVTYLKLFYLFFPIGICGYMYFFRISHEVWQNE